MDKLGYSKHNYLIEFRDFSNKNTINKLTSLPAFDKLSEKEKNHIISGKKPILKLNPLIS